jgi:glutamyl-Q tRNA(Asp) synthetase
LLQAVLDLNVPDWRHHRLILDDAGGRLAKRTQALAIRSLRESGETPEMLRARLGL